MNLGRAIANNNAQLVIRVLFDNDGQINISDGRWTYNASITGTGEEKVTAITLYTLLKNNDLEKFIY